MENRDNFHVKSLGKCLNVNLACLIFEATEATHQSDSYDVENGMFSLVCFRDFEFCSFHVQLLLSGFPWQCKDVSKLCIFRVRIGFRKTYDI